MLSDFCGLVRTRGRNSLINSKMENRRRTSKLPKYFADLSLLNIISYDIHGVPLKVFLVFFYSNKAKLISELE